MPDNQRLKNIRLELGYSQQEFAGRLGIKQGSYSDIERGKSGISQTIRIILEQIIGVSHQYLETGSGDIFMDKSIEYANPSNKVRHVAESHSAYHTDNDCSLCLEKDKIIESQNEIIRTQNKQVLTLKQEISMLKNKKGVK